jgi:hypothetical protein
MHPRTIIRHRAGYAILGSIPSLADRVYLSRSTAVNASMMPCVCIYTKNERTVDSKSKHVRMQEVDLAVEIFTRREADSGPWKKLPWMPNAGGQTFDADDVLDEACKAIEVILYDLFSGRNVLSVGITPEICIFTESVAEISTEIKYSEQGETPYAEATMMMRIQYQNDFAVDSQTCEFLGALGHFDLVECQPDLENPTIQNAPDGTVEASERVNIREV